MTIQTNVQNVNRNIHALHEAGKLEKRVLAVGIEMNQRYLEYLEELETAPLQVANGINIEVDGSIIHFDDMESFSSWLSEQS